MSSTTKSDRLQFAGHAQQTSMPALIIVLYASAVYLLFLAVLGYAVGFFAGFGVPKGIDQGPRAAVPVAVVIDLLLLSLFAVQHTVMARPWFKRRWTRIVPEAAERASFVLAASLALALLFWLWRPIGGTVWKVPGPGADLLWAVYAAGWATAVGSTFLISHSDLFGLRQAWLPARHVRYGRSPAIRGRSDRLHRCRHRVRGTRPDPQHGRYLHRLPGPRARTDPAPAAPGVKVLNQAKQTAGSRAPWNTAR